jgi:hypothetical protein
MLWLCVAQDRFTLYFKAVLSERLWYKYFNLYLILHCILCHLTVAVIQTKQFYYSVISGYPFLACLGFSPRRQLQVYAVGQNIDQSCSYHTN